MVLRQDAQGEWLADCMEDLDDLRIISDEAYKEGVRRLQVHDDSDAAGVTFFVHVRISEASYTMWLTRTLSDKALEKTQRRLIRNLSIAVREILSGIRDKHYPDKKVELATWNGGISVFVGEDKVYDSIYNPDESNPDLHALVEWYDGMTDDIGDVCDRITLPEPCFTDAELGMSNFEINTPPLEGDTAE